MVLVKGIFKMIIIQDSESLQLIHEQQPPVALKQLNQHRIFDLHFTPYFLLYVSLPIVSIAILAG
jgi:hypothetical protein